MSTYDTLIKKLDHFIRRFYLNRLLKGLLLFLIGLGGVVLVFSLGEYLLYFPAWFKVSILILLFLLVLWALVFWIIKPILGMEKIGKIISREQAAGIIGDFFPEIQDKLLNILQLKTAQYDGESAALAMAEIEQKSGTISLVPIGKAVNLGHNKRYLKWLLPLLLILLGLAFFQPNIFKEAVFRWSQPEKNFYPPPPFTFEINNSNLSVPANKDFTLHLSVKGDKLPQQVALVANGKPLYMTQNGKTEYKYTFHQVQENIPFHFQAAGFRSKNFKLEVLQQPQLENLSVKAVYPAYTGIKNKTLNSVGQLSVPTGTKLVGTFNTMHTDNMSLIFSKSPNHPLNHPNDNQWQWHLTALKDTTLKVTMSNKVLPHYDTISFAIETIKDQAPQLDVKQHKDTISGRKILLTGNATDDYGLSRLIFHYKITNQQNKTVKDTVRSIVAPNNKKNINFHYYFDINTLHLQLGQTVRYFVAAWDNDAVLGSKKTISQIFTYHQGNEKELKKEINENNKAINDQLKNSNNQAENINKELAEFRKKMLQNKGMNWEQKQSLETLKQQQKKLGEKVAALKRRFKKQQRQSQQKNYSENIRQKQKALENQLDKVQNQELAKLQKMLQKLDKQKNNKANTFQTLKEWQQKNQLFQMDMKRIKELMKQLTMKMQLEDMAQKAKELAKSQDSLAKKTKNNQQSKQKLANAQNDLKKQLDSLMNKGFKEAQKANQQLKHPKDMKEAKKIGQQAQQNMHNSQHSLQQGHRQQSEQQQKKSSQNLNKLASSLTKMAGGMSMKMVNINIRAVRQLLTNLLRFSFEQEALMKDETQRVNVADLQRHLKKQQILKENANMIKDSLQSLGEHLFSLAPRINDETSQLTDNINKSISRLENRRINNARIAQQYAMTNANNLALMLDETLRHLMQMKSQGQGQGSGMPSQGKKPSQGKGKSPGQMMKDIMSGQKKLGKGMSEMQGQKNGKNGQNQQNNNGNSEKQAMKLAKMAQRQAQLRQMMQDLNTMLNSKGMGENAQLIKEIQKDMKRNEVDFVNRRLNSKLIDRQHRIMTRMLKAKNAIQQQGRENKRIAETAKDQTPPMPPELKAVLQKRKAFMESYRTVPATLKSFYKKMNEKYQTEIGR